MGAPTERNLPNKPRIRIFFFGDSICFGQGVSPHFTWVTRLSRALDERLSSRADVLTQNPSVNGNTTRMALERMPYDVQSHAPDVLYIQFGLNDCNGWDQTWRPEWRFRFTRSIAPHASSTATRLITHSPTTNADQRMPKITGNDKVIVIDTPGPVWKMPASTDIRRLHDCAGASSAQKRLPNR